MTNQTAPQNVEAEESVLGAMLLSSRAVEEVAGFLPPEAFYRERYAIIYRVMLELFEHGTPIDPLTVSDALDEKSQLETVGGKEKIAELAAIVPSASNVSHYARIVQDNATLRALLRAGQEITRLGVDRPGPIDELLDSAELALSRVSSLITTGDTLPITDALEEFTNDLRAAYLADEPITGLKVGYPDLDAILLGYWPGQLILLAARPGQGKSALALNIAENIVDNGGAVLFVSLEMSMPELRLRSLARAAEIDSKLLITGQMTEEQARKLPHGLKVLASRANLHVNDTGALSLSQLNAEATRLRRTAAVNLIVVDYLQLMNPPKAENRNIEIGMISRNLKQLARRLNIPILALCQMSRAIEARNDKRPLLSDLRDSGSLEQDADVVTFIHDETAYDLDKQPTGTIEIIIAKNRRGETGKCKLTFNRRWSSLKHLPKHPGG